MRKIIIAVAAVTLMGASSVAFADNMGHSAPGSLKQDAAGPAGNSRTHAPRQPVGGTHEGRASAHESGTGMMAPK